MSASFLPDRFMLALGLALSCAITGCARDPIDVAQTVDYYRSHGKERQALLAACANDPGRLNNRPACINAQQAEGMESIGSLRKLPPMGLPGAGKTPSPTSNSPNTDAATQSRSN